MNDRSEQTTNIPGRLRSAVSKWFVGVPVFKPSRHGIVTRLRSDVAGPAIHPGYYRQDLIDAADEIERLQARVSELENGD